jgi:hypothetical protein
VVADPDLVLDLSNPERGRPTRVLQEEGAAALRTGVWNTLYTFDGDVLRIFAVIRIAI